MQMRAWRFDIDVFLENLFLIGDNRKFSDLHCNNTMYMKQQQRYPSFSHIPLLPDESGHSELK